MLYPAGKRVLDEGRLSTCLGNLRQLGVAANAYAGDHNGFLPTSLGTFWQRELAPYVGITPSSSGMELYGAEASRKTIFTCPFVAKDPTPRRSYGINYRIQQDDRVDGYQSDSTFSIQAPGNTMLFADSLSTSFIGIIGNMSFRHIQDRCGVAYADGHVENVSKEDALLFKTSKFFGGQNQ
ncbi:MAG: hypothetical protein BGO12_03825 [Verrucomicrobia bacterium 61-8]|nr:MAG: hypothetical protein BGO12_03825 [Verrucomicrobia bacterium 61-8]